MVSRLKLLDASLDLKHLVEEPLEESVPLAASFITFYQALIYINAVD